MCLGKSRSGKVHDCGCGSTADLSWSRRSRPFLNGGFAMQYDSIAHAIQIAVAHHHAGRLEEAERRYREVLARQAENADVLHMLGVIAAQTKRHSVAIEMIRRAIAVK